MTPSDTARDIVALRPFERKLTTGIDVLLAAKQQLEAMLALSTYVGHAMVTNTYWYLQAVPELMALAAARFESFVSHAQVQDA